MSFIEEVRAKRKKLADVLSDEDYSGIREIVEELYPDKAHFIYELLQNAEDTGATEVTFTLDPDTLIFEHNGRTFSDDDVWGITNIGKGTKKADEEAIGRFGVGFKAVFAYTETPRIWSPTHSFEISALVLPSQLVPIPELGRRTRFQFPFNNQKKPAPDAYAEVRDGLNELSETTLLFLSHIDSIAWTLPGRSQGKVLRITHSEHHVEVLKQVDERTTGRSHYLRFAHPVEEIRKQSIAIAFALDLAPRVDAFNCDEQLADQFRIVPANPGRVAVFFPAEKEASGLRFHIHAPFVPELSRASIKETAANTPLYRQLANLMASSLHAIRDLKLLTADFLGVLPNPQDSIPSRYDGIRRAVVTEMNEKPLTPTYSKGYAPAKHLLQAKASLKNLLSIEDLKFLLGHDDDAILEWAIGAAQKNSAIDRFLSGLDIREWDIAQFVALLKEQTSRKITLGLPGHNVARHWGPQQSLFVWLRSKPDIWLQKFYAMLFNDYLIGNNFVRKQLLEELTKMPIVRISNGKYSEGSKCFFPADEIEEDDILPRVARAILESGKDNLEQESVRKLLEAIGVRHIGEAEQVEAILKQRYVTPHIRPSKGDFFRFIALVEKDAQHAVIFKDYWIFQREDGEWGKPGQVYLDVPYLDTGLSAYYGALGDKANCGALSNSYQEEGVSTERLENFARKVGVICELTIAQVSCQNNPDVKYLVHRAPGSRTSYQIDKDYTIHGLDRVLDSPTEPLSRLVWQTCSSAIATDWTKARYRNNSSYSCNEAPSQLALLLRSKKWIPQIGGAFVYPAQAVRDLLPDGFAFDPGWPWLKAIQFGESTARQAEESHRKREVAKELGFNDEDSLNDAKWFAELDPEERRRFKTGYENRHCAELPEHHPVNLERRAGHVQQLASEAPERRTEMRTRSVSVGRESVKKDTDPYLRQQYSNRDDEVICQVCKTVLPFKLADGSYYMEAVEFLPELKKLHYQNYLALCPNHAAMFQHANGSREHMKKLFLALEGNELAVILASEDFSIYFTKTHITDIQAVILADDAGKGEEE